MKYAVIKVAGKQYKVSEEEKLLVDKLKDDFSVDVLMVNNNGDLKIGKPYLDKKLVKYRVGEVTKGKKIDVIKYKAKSRYRKHIGFRPKYTILHIEKIT